MLIALLAKPAVKWALAGLAAIILIAGLFLWLNAREEADDSANQAAGVQAEQGRAAQQTVENVKEATNAREEVSRNTDNARYNACMHAARTPENCRRFYVPD